MEERKFVFRVNSKDRIVWVNDAWNLFARENKAEDLCTPSIIGKSVLSYISDPATRHIYESIMEKVRNEYRSLEIPYRCDSPSCRRFMKMTISPLDDHGLEFKNEIVKLEYREPVKFLEEDTERSDEFIRICSWCKKVDIQNSEWVEVEEAVRKLNLFNVPKLPGITHGICVDCEKEFLKKAGIG